MNKWWKMEKIGAFYVGDGIKRRIQVLGGDKHVPGDPGGIRDEFAT